MSKGKKLIFLFLIAGLYLVVRVSFLPLELNDRAIILGVGVDYDENQKIFTLSAEIVTPKQDAMGSESSATQGSQKIVKGNGESVGLAIRDLFNSFGKTPSFGECGIIMLGETCAKKVLLQNSLDYFIESNAFRDGTIVVVCEGDAQEMLKKRSQVDEYVSFALQTLLVQSGSRAQIQYTTLNSTAQGFFDKSEGCFLNLIKFERQDSAQSESSAGGSQSDNKYQGKFKTGQMALFSDGKYVGELNRQEVNGLNLFDDKNIFCSFVDRTNPQKSALGLDTKRVKREIEFREGKVVVRLDVFLGIKPLLTDTVGEVFSLKLKETSQLNDLQKKGVREDAKNAILLAFDKCAQTDCDFLGVKNALYAKYGKDYDSIIKQTGEGKSFWNNVILETKIKCEG